VSLYDWIRLSHIEKCPKEIEQNLFHDDDDVVVVVGTYLDNENDVNSDNENNDLTFCSF
jgi:ribosomal protein L18E